VRFKCAKHCNEGKELIASGEQEEGRFEKCNLSVSSNRRDCRSIFLEKKSYSTYYYLIRNYANKVNVLLVRALPGRGHCIIFVFLSNDNKVPCIAITTPSAAGDIAAECVHCNRGSCACSRHTMIRLSDRPCISLRSVGDSLGSRLTLRFLFSVPETASADHEVRQAEL
jgi:hypothetical protein